MKMITIFSAPIVALLFGCASGGDPVSAASAASTVRPQHEVVNFFGFLVEPFPERGAFDFQNLSPLDFLQELRQCAKSRDRLDFILWNEHRGWVLESDLPGLIALLDSDEPVCYVHRAIDSVRLSSRSTVGKEAAHLIDAFRQGVYPPRGFSDPEEIRRWWKEYQHKKQG
jgi:hypothetical protein